MRKAFLHRICYRIKNQRAIQVKVGTGKSGLAVKEIQLTVKSPFEFSKILMIKKRFGGSFSA